MHFGAFSGDEMHPVTTDLACGCAVQMHFFILEQQKVVRQSIWLAH